MLGAEPGASEEESESEDSESVDESNESSESSAGDEAPFCDASVVNEGRSWVSSLLQCTHTM